MALNTLKCNYLMPLPFKGLTLVKLSDRHSQKSSIRNVDIYPMEVQRTAAMWVVSPEHARDTRPITRQHFR